MCALCRTRRTSEPRSHHRTRTFPPHAHAHTSPSPPLNPRATTITHPRRSHTSGKYREHNSIEGTPVNDFIATCILGTGFCQVLNDYELKNNGKFGMMGAWAANGDAPAADGTPASTEMKM